MLAVVRERRLVECLEDDVNLLLEEVSVAGLVEQWRAESFHLTRVVSSPYAKDDTPTREDVHGGKVFRKP